MSFLSDQATRGRQVEPAEPELTEEVEQFDGETADEADRWIGSATSLFLLAVARMESLLKRDPDSWLGPKDVGRLPPRALIADCREACARGEPVGRYMLSVLDRLVIRQHETNALRKLAAQPTVDSAKLIFEGRDVMPVGRHRAGTSNPRFYNTIQFLADLGFLSLGKGTELTDDGLALLATINSRGVGS